MNCQLSTVNCQLKKVVPDTEKGKQALFCNNNQPLFVIKIKSCCYEKSNLNISGTLRKALGDTSLDAKLFLHR